MRTIYVPLATLVVGMAVLALAKPKFSQAPAGAPAVETGATVSNDAASQAVDLSGEWVLDRSESDMGRMRDGDGPRGHDAFRARDGFRGRDGRMGGRRGDGRRMRLPAHLHITQSGALVRFADSSGTVLQEIATDSDTTVRSPGAFHRLGAWSGAALEVRREGRGGMTFLESWRLEGAGRLVSTTRIEGGVTDRVMKRVYRRVRES